MPSRSLSGSVESVNEVCLGDRGGECEKHESDWCYCAGHQCKKPQMAIKMVFCR